MVGVNAKNHPIRWILLVYSICFIFRAIEYLFIRTDQSFIGEAFIHKLAGIAVLALAVWAFGYTWKDIGFDKTIAFRFTLWGLLLGMGVYFIAYLTEVLLLIVQGANPGLQFFVSSFTVDGNEVMDTNLLFILICITGNVINVVMEEGVFRGLFIRLAEEKHTFAASMLLASACFGIWHIAQAARSYIDGNISFTAAAVSALGYIALTFVMGIKFGLLVKITGSLWTPMAEHFVNNTIVNLLHITTDTGVDEYQFVRISIAQTVSFLIVLIIFIKSGARKKPTFR